jgi:catechol 2,3-dioxygenase-like lactoylglutathione lyase family enzyme
MLKITHLTIVVANYDEAIAFYTEKLGFVLIEDTPLNESKRWVLIAPNATASCQILLAKAINDEQKSRIGNQTGGRVSFFLETDNFEETYLKMNQNGIIFKEKPRNEIYGKVVVFQDLYGNLWDLIEYK